MMRQTPKHVGQVIHDLTHHEMLIDANRVLGNKDITGAIVDVYGDVTYKHMQQALLDVAAGSLPAVSPFEKALNYTRSGVTIASKCYR